MSHARVVHCKRAEYDVYVGRGPDPRTGAFPKHSWGNLFRIPEDGDRPAVLQKHREWALMRPFLVDRARMELHDQTLGCWCAPNECHGDTWAEIAASTPVCHEQGPCTCSDDHECAKCKGLYVCLHCGGAEGSLTSECPRTRVSAADLDAVYNGQKNYICGTWVAGCVKDDGEVSMPYWAGRVHCV